MLFNQLVFYFYVPTVFYNERVVLSGEIALKNNNNNYYITAKNAMVSALVL